MWNEEFGTNVCPEGSKEYFGEEYNCINSDLVQGYWTMTFESGWASPYYFYTEGKEAYALTSSYGIGIRPVITLPTSALN